LWCAEHLKNSGDEIIVLEKDAIGSGQTIASQGMIHGGTKYSLDGSLARSTIAISEMPEIWRNALNGIGSVDLSKSKILTDSQVLWSLGGLPSRLAGFFGSKVMSSKMKLIEPMDHDAFISPSFKGSLFELNEPVVDVQSVLVNLTSNLSGRIFKATVKSIISESGKITGVVTDQGIIKGDEVILAAGEGNAQILQNSGIASFPMQIRPLAMGMVFMKTKIPDIYGHQLGASNRPVVTVSTHYAGDQQVLYVGGVVAESGVGLCDADQKQAIKTSIEKALHWLDLDIEHIEILRINRAEPKLKSIIKPDSYFCGHKPGLIVCWPTKLAFAPALASDVAELCIKSDGDSVNTIGLTTAQIAEYPWVIN
jgi:hypothetical protein